MWEVLLCALYKTSRRETLRPPPVLPAHAPTIISSSKIAFDMLFTDLYRVPENAKFPYFRTKVLEMLVCLSVMDAKEAKYGGTYFYKDKVEKTRAVQKLISENIDRDYTIKKLSMIFDISQTALKECFKNLYGKPLYTWLKEYRIGRAREYLTERDDMTICDIAEAVGYKSQAKFGAVFKKICGMTPNEYRNQKH